MWAPAARLRRAAAGAGRRHRLIGAGRACREPSPSNRVYLRGPPLLVSCPRTRFKQRETVMRTFTAAVGLFGVLASQVALAQEPPPGGATTPPPAETTPPPTVATPSSTGAPQPFGPAAGPAGPSVWGILPWGGYGIGARYMIPLPITQLLTRTKFHDYWALEFGADMLHFSYDYGFGAAGSYSWTEIVPVVGMMWQFWINDSFAVYPKVEVGYAFGWYSGTQGPRNRHFRGE